MKTPPYFLPPYSYFLLVLTIGTFLVSVPSISYAQNPPANNTTVGGPAGNSVNPSSAGGTAGNGKIIPLQNPLSKNLGSIGALIEKFLEIFSYIVIIFAVLLIVWVGLRFILSRGNPAELKKNGIWLSWIVAGVAIVLGARLMVSIIISTLESTGTVNKGVTDSARNALEGR
ncbi:MAG: hypothetical protein A3B11_01295 [Candidatus Taylorbacteria bacterium RIFCSPLOWO2_01_FULL_44_26]|uniref:Uncharacterized protein n=2 Tax=Candidatus Tayloriibacteriota TaxID=1817919 RepID=A0A1G2MJS8_9BACT|nr:MAG: hypothetical protein A3D50_01075 [Candidatus Taylorbacteria bacterium RIFCSPHIGHO2_02_FULL_44_12]OHA30951.1 MAG: hypothetical protein A3B11_01295 [Candidatus Taylorbacteria bacterium RIFCSPLOWO2_01_FULL_44_26]